ncbi:MAG: ABC transporter substrate-binding protein [Bacteroidota bacterium]|nr:ABC transporter substrate-binding protein [Bacteroidota bacterium]
MNVLRFLFFAVLIAINACQPDGKTSTSKNVFRYNETKGISTLDPAFAKSQTLIWPDNQLYNGLLEMDDSLRLRPSVAKRWEVSADGLTYTFYLRNDVYFHDNSVFLQGKGRKVVAPDFVYSFRRIVDSKTASPGAWVFNNVDRPDSSGIIALNDSVLQIKLRKRFAAFAGLLTTPYCFVVPREVVEYYGDDFRSHPVGTGPFMLKTWREGEKLVLVKNPHYFEKDSAGRRLPYLDAIAITFISDKQSEFLEFVKGNIDFLSGVHTAYRNELLTRGGKLNPKYARRFAMAVQPYLNTEYLGCMIDPQKMSGNPLLNRKVRLAINSGFDRAKMLKYLRNNLGTPAYWGIIPKGLPGYIEQGEGYRYNPDLSRRLLAEAGFPDGKNLPEITLTTTSDYLDLCEFIQHDLSQIGIRLKIEVSTGATFREMVANSKVQLFRASWIADYPDAENYLSLFYSPNHSPQGPNYTHFTDASFDHMYESALSEDDANKRILLYRDMNHKIFEDGVIIPLYYDMVVRFYPKNIRGFAGNPLNLLKLKTVRKIN